MTSSLACVLLAFATVILPKTRLLHGSCLDSLPGFCVFVFVLFCIVLFLLEVLSVALVASSHTQLKAQGNRLHFSRVRSSFDLKLSSCSQRGCRALLRFPAPPQASRKQAGSCRARPVHRALRGRCPVPLLTQCVKPSVPAASPALEFFWREGYIWPLLLHHGQSGGSLLSYRVGTARRGFFLEDPSYRRKIRARVVGG